MKIKKQIIEALIDHAKKDAPLEACGYLASVNGVITVLYPLSNIDKSSVHFSFDPGEQFIAMRDARAKALEICAVYHSHPHTPARPSPEDIKLAHDPSVLYVIVSLAGENDMVKAFKIRNQEVEQVDLEVITDAGI